MDFSGCHDDDSFGPTVRGCRDDFDFTIRFEQIILAIIPCAVFTALSLPRLLQLYRSPVLVSGAFLRAAKLISVVVLIALQLGVLGVVASNRSKFTSLFVASSTLYFVASLAIGGLSYLEHGRSLRPSILISSYLLLAILFDTTQARTLWLARSGRDAETQLCRLYTAALVAKAGIIVLESLRKTPMMRLAWNEKDHSPEETSGIISLGSFAWLRTLFVVGFRKVLDFDDLYPLDHAMNTHRMQKKLDPYLVKPHTAEKGTAIVTSQGSYNFGATKYGLLAAIFKAMAVPLLIPAAPRLAQTGFQFCQPFLINSALTYLSLPSDMAPHNNGIGLIGATIIVYFGSAISQAIYWYFQERAVFMIRAILAGAVYRKTTEARLNTGDDSAAVTLMSTDVERVRVGFLLVHECWSNLIQVGLAAWLLYGQLGISFLAPVVVVLVCTLVSSFTTKYTGTRQKAWMGAIQKRVGMTSNAVMNMKHLKISGLSAPIEAIIQNLRLQEIQKGVGFRMMLVAAVVTAYFPSAFSPVFTFAVTGKSLDVTTVFTSLSFIILLTSPLATILQIYPSLITSLVCMGRLQAFLEKDARVDYRESLSQRPSGGSKTASATVRSSPDSSSPAPTAPGIVISEGSYGWEPAKYNLKDLDVSFPAGQLTIVVGPIASGKSTLCQALIGETPEFAGHMQVDMRTPDSRVRHVGYCNQVPYLYNASLRENIIGLPASDEGTFNEQRYNEALEASMLRPDIALLPLGDKSMVGSNGITLSGGQKQRVSIARALYANPDLYIFDDILSGLDADTEEQVYRRVFGPEGILARDKATAVLCTHSVRHLPSANHIVALSASGTVLEQGTFEDLVANRKYIHSLDIKSGDSSHESGDSGDEDPRNLAIIPAASRTSSSQRDAAGASSSAGPTKYTPDTELLRSATAQSKLLQRAETEKKKKMEAARSRGDRTVFKYYGSLIGLPTFIMFLAGAVGMGFFSSWGNIWLKFWTENRASEHPSRSNGFYIGLYGLFQAMQLICMGLTCVMCLRNMIRSSGSRLHLMTLQTVIRAPLWFFTKTDTGVIINHFSQDITLIDGELPMALINSSTELFISAAAAAVVATASPWLIIAYPFLAVILYVVQMFYLRTSRQLRLLDLEAKSPLYTHFLDTIRGVTTFRAFGWEQAGIARNEAYLDRSQRPAYQLAMVQHWLSFTLQMMVALLAIGVMALATQLRSSTGLTGASLVSLMSFGDSLAHLIQSYTQLETSIGAVSRLKSLQENVPPEAKPEEVEVPGPEWPTQGVIELKDVSASYEVSKDAVLSNDGAGSSASITSNEQPPLVLSNLTLTIRSGEKVAMCGRTGSGKSSTILLLLKLLDPYGTITDEDNAILVDGLSLSRIDRTALRERIIAVPQDAVFLPDGTSFQENLDPFGGADAVVCKSVLEAVGMWSFVEERGGIASGMVADTLSQGQKQLFSLARAMIRRRIRSAHGWNSGVLLLDEVSSSVDQDTDKAMQMAIQEEFADYTVVMVSHRLDMVMEACDRVIVLDKGRIVEQGHPPTLAATEGTRFRQLWLVGNKQ